jgi:hypothetical protein
LGNLRQIKLQGELSDPALDVVMTVVSPLTIDLPARLI